MDSGNVLGVGAVDQPSKQYTYDVSGLPQAPGKLLEKFVQRLPAFRHSSLLRQAFMMFAYPRMPPYLLLLSLQTVGCSGAADTLA